MATVAGGTFAWLRRSPVDGEPVPNWVQHLHANEYQLMKRMIPVLLPVAGTNLTPPEQVPVMKNTDAMIGMVAAHVRKDLGKGGQSNADGDHKTVDYRIADVDFPAMQMAIKASARVQFAAGAERVFVPSSKPLMIESEADIARVVTSLENTSSTHCAWFRTIPRAVAGWGRIRSVP